MARTPNDYPTSYWAANTKVLHARDHRHLTLSGTATTVHSVRPSGSRDGSTRGDEWAYAVRYHYTDVVTFYLGGDVLLNTGGWSTLTTHRKMSACLVGAYVASNKGQSIYIRHAGTVEQKITCAFHDTLLIHQEADSITFTADNGTPVTYSTRTATLEPQDENTVRLHDVQGFARRSGTDQHGNQWSEFEVDSFAEQEAGECSICGAEIDSGWLCLDGGDEVCAGHVEIAGE